MILGLLKNIWWKVGAVLLLLYTLLGGLLIPLGPGIKNVELVSNTTDSTKTALFVYGKNTHFQEALSSLDIWLINSENALCTDHIVHSNTLVEVSVHQEQHVSLDELTSSFCDVLISNNLDGNLIQYRAVSTSNINIAYADSMECSIDYQSMPSAVFSFPNRAILYESIRNLFFHVPMWFSMVLVLFFAFIMSVRYLLNGKLIYDTCSAQAIHVALLFGILGVFTGMIWAKYTWGAFWPNDPKLNGAAIALLIYFAYLILRGSIQDEIKRAKISSVYNIFAFVMYLTFIFIIPRITDSLHPGNGGNPGFGQYDLDNTLRLFFYPAVIGWTLLGFWIVSIKIRYKLLKEETNVL